MKSNKRPHPKTLSNSSLKGEEAKAKDIVTGLSEIETFETMETAEEGCTKLRITCKEKQDARETLFYAFAKEEMPILEMIHHEKSLEDVFLELTQGAEAQSGQGEQGVETENPKEETTVQEAEEQSNAGDL